MSLIRQVLVGGEQAGGMRTQRDDDRTGERGKFHDRLRVVALRVEKRIRKDDPSLGIGIEHLDRFTAKGFHDVTRPVGVGTGHIFGGGDQTQPYATGV